MASPFVPRTRATIRTSLLTDWAARYASLNPAQVLNTVLGSDAYMWADALALELEGLESQAAALTANILPDQADPTYLARHGAVDGVAQLPAVAWSGKVQINGTSASAVITFGTSVLVYNGVNYGSFADPTTGAPITSVTCSSSVATVRVTAAVTGSATQLPDGTVLTWSSLPTNATGTGAVITGGTVITATDAETPSAWAARIIARRQERPASGNRADWQAWVTQFASIADAFVYPLYHPTLLTGTLGAVSVVAVGPIAKDANGIQNGDNASADVAGSAGRFITAGTATNIGGYLEGTNDANGNAAAAGIVLPQLRPVTIATADYQVIAATPSAQKIDIQVVFGTGYAPPFTYNAGDLAIAGVPGLTATTFSIAGDVTSRYTTTAPILVKVLNGSTQVLRGNYYLVTPTARSYDGTNTNFTIPSLTTTFSSGALVVANSVVMPAPPNWQLLRLAIFGLIDGLGPADSSPTARWPTPATRNSPTLYKSAIIAAVQQQLSPGGTLVAGVRGIVSASVVSPGADTTPAVFNMVSLGDLLVHV